MFRYSEDCTKLLIAIYLVWLLAITSTFAEDKLVWEDEFNGNTINKNKWNFDLGDGCQYGQDLCGWGNDELQWYQEANAEVKNGKLHIIVKNEDVGTKKYTSAKLMTKLKGDWKFGRVDIRAKLPKGQAIWPAIWMLPTEKVFGGWPRSGEIDIMEMKGQTPQTVDMTAHYGHLWNNKSQSGTEYTLSSGTFADDFHVFSIEWSKNQINWLIDGVKYHTLVAADVTNGGYVYPFNEKFYLILNVAVGGGYGGTPDSRTVLPVTMEVDYVKVYCKSPSSEVNMFRKFLCKLKNA